MGRLRLVYELHLANFADEDLTVRRVEILDPDRGTVLTRVNGDSLNHRLRRPGVSRPDRAARTIAPGMHAVLYVELTVDPGGVPNALEHRIMYGAAGDDARRPAVVRGGYVEVPADLPVVLAQPLRGGPWAAVYHPSWERGHRRVVYAVDGRARIPGRFAIDFMMLNREGHLARNDADSVTNWYGHGADVLAVADAVVAAARDDVPESATLSGNPKPALEDATGNYIALDLGNGRYVFYEHLAPGSVRVARGQRVTRGQVIASLGFTGSSTGPHLHLHVADANSPLGAEGMPFVLDSFAMLGVYDDVDRLGNAAWSPLDDVFRPRRLRERPAPNAVIEFGNS